VLDVASIIDALRARSFEYESMGFRVEMLKCWPMAVTSQLGKQGGGHDRHEKERRRSPTCKDR
jgi:hypothetical protein